MSENPPAGPEPSEGSPPPAERQSTPFLVLQFFVFPMAIVAVCVAVFVVFGLIASEGRGARDYLAEVRAGGASRRWQAAFELSKVLQAGKDPALKDPRFVAELGALFDEASDDDPRVRRYLALAIGRLGDPRALPSLLRFLREAGPESDSETVIFCVWAAGAIGDASAIPELLRLAQAGDAGVRKTVGHALGGLPGEEPRAALLRLLEDAVEDVRWNAALGLARRGDAAAVPMLLRMLDRAALSGVEGLAPEQREEAMLQAVTAAARLTDPELRGSLARLRDADPSLKLRQAARAALERGAAAAPAAAPSP